MNQTNIAVRNKSGWLSDLDALGSAQGLRRAMLARNADIDVATLRSFAIVGAGPEGQRLARLCASRDIRIDAIADEDPAKRNMIVGGRRVAPVESLTELP